MTSIIFNTQYMTTGMPGAAVDTSFTAFSLSFVVTSIVETTGTPYFEVTSEIVLH